MNPLQIYLSYQSAEASKRSEMAGFSLRNSLIPHQQFKRAVSTMAELHHYSLQNEVGGGIVITGPSGVGKTTILKHYLGLNPRVEEREKSRIPVLHVVTPSSPTVRSMTDAILIALGASSAGKRSAEEKTLRIYKLLKLCEIELLLIDEFQHFYYANTIVEFRKISDWLKNLISHTGLAVVLTGLPEAELVVRSNEQLERRFSTKLALTPFSLESPDDFQEFRGILKQFQEKLPLRPEIDLYENNLARRFLVASNGLLDYVRKILEGAVSIALSAGHQSLDLQTYAAGFRKEVWSDVPDRLNPFHPNSPLRKLNHSGEPFYAEDKRQAIGSPLARRIANLPASR